MIDLGNYKCKVLGKDKIAPEDFMNEQVYKVYKSEKFRTYTKRFHKILDSDLIKVIKNKYRHLTE